MQSENRTFNRNADFIAELTPYRSLGKTGFAILMAFVSVACFLSAMAFLVMGAWPVVIFLGLDVFVIWAAFRINYRSASARELVFLRRDELKVQKFDPRGRLKEHVFNPLWARFEIDRHDEIGIVSMQIASRDLTLPIGSFLNPEDRESFASAFSVALGRARHA